MQRFQEIWTLGPSGTNCEAAAQHYIATRLNGNGKIVLSETLESAVASAKGNPDRAVLGCVVYPDLHKIVFSNLDGFELSDVFLFPTSNMVLASWKDTLPERARIVSHPAPSILAPRSSEIIFVTSNVVAASDCISRKFDGCITTEKSAKANGLKIIQDFGPVNMGFTIHSHKEEKAA